MKKLTIILVGLFSTALLFTACKKEKGEHNEEEVITTVELSFTPAGGGATVKFKFNDPDGPGGAAPTTDKIVLAPNTVYQVSAAFRNDIANEDITAEIIEEGDAHRIYYTAAAGSNISISNLNNDGDGNPLGITSTWTTAAIANGQVTVTLRHYGSTPPDKQAADPVNSPKSSTDAEVVFATEVK